MAMTDSGELIHCGSAGRMRPTFHRPHECAVDGVDRSIALFGTWIEPS
jgi:hypothetical protein